jgi:hypothetical protein
MKKIFKYLPIILGLVMVMSSCGDDDETQPATAAASPSLNISVNGTADQSTYTVDPNASITIAITANKVTTERDLDVIRIDQNGANALASGTSFEFNSATEMYDFTSNADVTIKNDDDEIFNVTGVFTNITSSVGITTYTITVTDKDGTATTRSFDLVVESPTVPFNETKTGNIWHISSSAKGSWNLRSDSAITSDNGVNEMTADIINTTAVLSAMDGAFKVGDTRTNTNFVIADSMFDYDNATITSATEAYNAGTADADKADVAVVGNVYLFMVGSDVMAVKITELNATDATNTTSTSTGFMSFEYKK